MLKGTTLVLIILANACQNGCYIHYSASEKIVSDKQPFAFGRNVYTECIQNMCIYYMDHVNPNERSIGSIDRYCGGCSVNIQSIQQHVNWSYSIRVKYERNDNKYSSDHILFYDGNGNGRYHLNTINMSRMTDIKFISDTDDSDLLEYAWYNKIRSITNMTFINDLNLWDINNNYNINANVTKTAEYLDEANIGGCCDNVSCIYVALYLILIFGFYIKWKYLFPSQTPVDIELEYGESLSLPLDWEKDNNVPTSIPIQQSDDNGHFEYPPWDEYAFIDQVEGGKNIEVNPEQEVININLMSPQNNNIHQDDGQFEYPPWAEYSDDL